MNRVRRRLLLLPLAVTGLLTGCGIQTEIRQCQLPEDFNSRDDASKVDYMMKQVSPDSVARFICNGALGKINGIRIDTIAIAVAHAYANYNDSSLILFSREFDDYSSNLELADKMRIYLMSGLSDPKRLGYELGLEYVDHIRADSMQVKDVKEELEAFKAACSDDTLTYVRFIKGFKTALRLDHTRDLSEEIYNAFINY
ncbi:MAG: hypothetical protein HDR88_16075 [Bacteroides sp.]|nr:hypothetical protein [Bacteroides sp.]